MPSELSRNTILEAMQRFDNELRDTWGELETAYNVVEYNGLLYPIWQIISMASQHDPNLSLKDAVACIRRHTFSTLRVKTRMSIPRISAHVGSGSLIRRPGKYKREREFEDRVIVPLLERWGFTYQRQYRCRFPTEYGVIDFFVSDHLGTLTLFENKRHIRNETELHDACQQAKRYAQWYRLPSFVVAAEQGLWVYALHGQNAPLAAHTHIDGHNAAVRKLLLELRA
jgi:hypothetical protein